MQDMKILCILFQEFSNELKKVYPVCHYIHINTFLLQMLKQLPVPLIVNIQRRLEL